MADSGQRELLAADASGARLGVRLDAVEVLNWGTFDKHVWRLDLNGENVLLTGDIGSGKSTLVDAITTLLAPAHKIAYNKAAGAETRERDLRSYVLGHYKSERGDVGLAAKPVALRSSNSYSVILGRFRNEGFGEHVTLAQVFWFREKQGQPQRFYVVSDRPLSIVEHFSNFGKDIASLRKRLRNTPHLEMHDTFPLYGAAFRRRFGIASEQALDLFLQTVSMKSVGDLTDFVRSHMLEPFPVEERIAHMIAHFDDLTRAHEAVLKARAQIEALTPIVTDCDRHTALTAEIESLKSCREALRAFFASHKIALLEKRVASLEADGARIGQRLAILREREQRRGAERDEIKQAILANGGDRIAAIGREIETKTTLKEERAGRANAYAQLSKEACIGKALSSEDFVANRQRVAEEIDAAEPRQSVLQNQLTEKEVEFRRLRDEHTALTTEISSLKDRRSNMPANMLAVRDKIATALNADAARLPFAGELIEVREDARDWEGAAERVLHNFALSLLVPEEHYQAVVHWVDAAHLGGRLVYYRVGALIPIQRTRVGSRALANKLVVKDDSAYYQWIRREVDQRFDHVCCETLDEFRREETAITRSGQVKAGGRRHEKDDRHRIDDRTRYVLGWTNSKKIAALGKAAAGFETRIGDLADAIEVLNNERRTLQRRLGVLNQLRAYTSFRDLDWRSLALEIERLQTERRKIEEGSDVLRALNAQLEENAQALEKDRADIDKATREEAQIEDRWEAAVRQADQAKEELAALPEEMRTTYFPRLEEIRETEFGAQRLTVETCENRAHDMRAWLQGRIDSEGQKVSKLRDRIVGAMHDYGNRYPEDAYEVDASVDAASEYRNMLGGLLSDGLPRFEARFKELLNENTIREVAGFQSQLRRETQEIRDRIETINGSLFDIDYNPGRYIVIEAQSTGDQEIRDFQSDLRSCTEDTLAGSNDSSYSEKKFLEVKHIIERFRGREGSAEADRRWTRKVTDVRNWFVFSASERRRSDGVEHEHYSDSGGKSGGQKEKLAYTILAASLAYQFNLDWRAERSRAFHFVVIDEAFGRGSDESARYGLELFKKMGLQLLIATPLQKIHVIEPYVAGVGFVHNEDGRRSLLRNLTIEEYRAERLRRAG